MVKTINCDIFDSSATTILHVANIYCSFGTGIAKEIRKRYPRAYQVDKMTKHADSSKIGQFTFAAADKNQEQSVANLYAMTGIGTSKRQLSYDALIECLENLKSWMIKMEMDNEIIGIPYGMGAGLAGGDWIIVESIIQSIFTNSDFNVLICKI